MTSRVQEVLMGPGRWRIKLSDDTPVSVLDQITGRGLLSITPAWIPGADTDDVIFGAAVYTGYYEERRRRRTELAGPGLAALLGSRDGLSDLYESSFASPARDLESHIDNGVLRNETPNSQNGITKGAVNANATTYTLDVIAGTSPLEYLQLATDSAPIPAEWRINPDLTLDADFATVLFRATSVSVPEWGLTSNVKVILSPLFHGLVAGGGLRAYHVDMDPARTWRDYTTRVVAEDSSGSTSAADASSVPFIMPDGLALEADRYLAGDISPGDSATMASRTLSLHNRPAGVPIPDATIVESFDRRDLQPGDYVFLFDILAGGYYVDSGLSLTYHAGHNVLGEPSRVYGIDWAVEDGAGVYFRQSVDPAVWVDLSRWVVGERAGARLELGSPSRVRKLFRPRRLPTVGGH